MSLGSEQTNDSIKHATLEEAHEVIEAIDNNDYDRTEKGIGRSFTCMLCFMP